MEDAGSRIGYFERMLSDNPDNPTGLLALANEYGKADRRFIFVAVGLAVLVRQGQKTRGVVRVVR